MAAGYNVKVTRNEIPFDPNEGDVTALDIGHYVSSVQKPRGQETVFVASDLFENPTITSGLDVDVIIIEDDSSQTTTDTDFRTIYTDNIAEVISTFGTTENLERIGGSFNQILSDNLVLLNHMTDRAGNYSTDGFKAWTDTASFTKGDLLNTPNKIRNFSTELITTLLFQFRSDADTWLGVP